MEKLKTTGSEPTKEGAAIDSELLISTELPHIVSPDSQHDCEAMQRQSASQQSLQNKVLQDVLSGLDSWSFDIFRVEDDHLPKMVEKIFEELGFFIAFSLDIKKVRAFTLAVARAKTRQTLSQARKSIVTPGSLTSANASLKIKMLARYQLNPYHNFRHACDVLHAVYLLLGVTEAGKKFTQLEKFALALAALCHDVDHPGLTNAFLVATYDPLALRYNDRGVLENHHAATCFITMRGHDAVNLLNGLNEVEQKHVRKLMLTIILATDMDSHSRILHELTERLERADPFELSPPYTPPGSLSPLREEFSSFSSSPGSPVGEQFKGLEEGIIDIPAAMAEENEKFVKVYKNPLQSAPPITSSNDVVLLLQIIIKCADISNVVKPFFLSRRWAALLLLEWFRQGEIEKQLGLPISKFMDREDSSTLMAMTCGCIDYIAKPMYEATAKLLPKLHEEVLMNLYFNRQLWNQFSTNGRRASEMAHQILGQFAPPPLPKGTGTLSEDAPGRLEAKLVATFSGQYLAGDSPPSEKRHSPTFQSTLVAIENETGPKVVLLDSPAENWSTASLPPDQSRVGQANAAESEHLEDLNLPSYLLSTICSPTIEPEKQEKEIPRQSDWEIIGVVDTERLDNDPHLPSYEPEKQETGIACELPSTGACSPKDQLTEMEALSEESDEDVTLETSSLIPLTDLIINGMQESSNDAEESHITVDSEPNIEPHAEFSGTLTSEEPLSLLFGSSSNNGKAGAGGQQVSWVPGLLPTANLLIVDRNKRSIDAMAFRVPANVTGPTNVRAPSFRTVATVVDAEKGSTIVPQSQARVGFWEAIRTHPRVARLNRALDSNAWNAVFIIATFLALFADDVVKGFLPKGADIYEAHVLTACLILFLLEAVILSIFRDGYFISFFFWLDLLGSLTLVPLIIGIATQNLVLARTGRAAKTITRASKLLQASHIQAQIANFIPVVRFLKFVGQYRDSALISPEYEEGEEHISSKPSQLWTRLSELTTQKLILGVLVLIIVYPYFGTEEKDLAPLVSLNGLDYYAVTSTQFNDSLNRLLLMNENHGYEIEYLGVKDSCLASPQGSSPSCQGVDPDGVYIQIVPDPILIVDGRQEAQKKFRVSELTSVTSDSSRAQAFYSMKKRSKMKYGMNIALTVLILAILATWCFFLSRDSNRLLIQPIERMVQFVKELAEDPVSFAGKTIMRPTQDNSKVMETFFVEAALVKIASLTKVALGDAGMDILSVNLKGSEFNPMLPGKKIRACFGFCDIRNFTDATECLQEDVMMFVNRIADVVHNKVVLHSGFPNKNIGDAFLIVWKKTISDNTNKARATSFADRALRSFLDIIQCIETSQSLSEFAKHPAIQKRMPGYRIHMGFGLHVGWAIEGAIGSAHKVDPSYLSPHVNMASRLEAATKQYGVMLLISETVIAHLTKSSLRDSCRKLDRVTVKGSHEPLVLYTFDIPLFQQDLRGNPADYRDIFEEAVDNYISGDWAIALDKLEECSSLWPTDKPAQVLLNFMAPHNYIAPVDWQGYRELTEK